MVFAGDAQAAEVYVAAVATLVGCYTDQTALLRSPEWVSAEQAIERAYLSRDVQAFVAAVAQFEAVGAAWCVQRAVTDDTCLHAEDAAVVEWRCEHPEQLCARCWMERGR